MAATLAGTRAGRRVQGCLPVSPSQPRTCTQACPPCCRPTAEAPGYPQALLPSPLLRWEAVPGCDDSEWEPHGWPGAQAQAQSHRLLAQCFTHLPPALPQLAASPCRRLACAALAAEARAVLTHRGTTVSGIFTFDEAGLVARCPAAAAALPAVVAAARAAAAAWAAARPADAWALLAVGGAAR